MNEWHVPPDVGMGAAYRAAATSLYYGDPEHEVPLPRGATYQGRTSAPALAIMDLREGES